MEIEKIDKSNMRKTILDFPDQFEIGFGISKNVILENRTPFAHPENIIICGMGGSALPGDILRTIRPLDIFTHKSYGLPPQAGNTSFIICISYSGNTEETLSSFKEAAARKLPLLAITTGGKLGELCKKNKVPAAIIPPPYIPPRLALGIQFAALLQILANHNLLPNSFITEVTKLKNSLNSKKLEAQGKELAEKIYQKIPVIYSSESFREVARIWKVSINENAKIMAVSNYFPELNHNETVGWLKINERQISNKELLVIILKDKDEHERILKQMEITQDIIEKEGVKVETVNVEGKTTLEKMFSSIILGFWASYWLALDYGIDPTPVTIIDEFKKRLNK